MAHISLDQAQEIMSNHYWLPISLGYSKGKDQDRYMRYIDVTVRVLDVRPGSFGRTDVLVRPITGIGDVWVSLGKLKKIEKE